MDTIAKIRSVLRESNEVQRQLVLQAPLIQRIAATMIAALKKGGTIIAFGNGGSACDSQHLAAELVGRFRREKKPLRAVSLAANTAILTAVSNDYGYEYSFSKQIEALGRKGDIAFAISTSGNAANVIEAVAKAKKRTITTIGLSGKGGGKLAKAADLSFIVPSNNTARIQEAHLAIIHIIGELIEDAFA